jgi:hypothetical protein
LFVYCIKYIDSQPPIGLIIGLTLGGAVILCLVVVVICVVVRKQRHKHPQNNDNIALNGVPDYRPPRTAATT